MMSSPECAPSQPSMAGLEIAGALQAVYGDLARRDFVPDIHQDAAIQALGQALVSGVTSGYVEMATGGGKTLLEALVAEAVVRSGRRALMLAPTVQIAEQINGSSGETGLGRFTNLHQQRAVRQHFGSRRANAQAPVVVATYAGLLHDAKATVPRLGHFDVVIGDECHRSLGQETARVLTEYMPEAIKLGFSATPDYADDRRSEEVYGRSLFEFSLKSAIESGTTAAVNTLLYETGSTLELTDRRADFTDAELAKLIDLSERNGVAVQLAIDLVRNERQGIIACVPGRDNAHARVIARLLAQSNVGNRNIVAADVGSHLPPEEQKRRLKAYHRGEIDVLTFTRSLEEGWDSDRASFCLNLAPTASPVRSKQLLGRILRKKPDGKVGIFVDFVDEKEGVAKQQYTAFHALELDDIDVHRVLGRRHVTGTYTRARDTLFDIDSLFGPDLHQRLLRSHGKALRDVLVTKSTTTVDPLVAHWERQLAKEGMPAELPYNVALTPDLAKKWTTAVQAALRVSGEIPSLDEVIAGLQIPQTHKRVLGQYAIRDEWDDELATQIEDLESTIEEAVFVSSMKDALPPALDTLSNSEAGVVRLRFGLVDGEPKTLEEIGKIYGQSKERIRQIEAKTISKLRHPSRTRKLEGMLDTEVPSQEYPHPRVSDRILTPDFIAALPRDPSDKDGFDYTERITDVVRSRENTPLQDLYANYFFHFEHGNPDHVRHVVAGQLLRAKRYSNALRSSYGRRWRWYELDGRVTAVQRRIAELTELNTTFNPSIEDNNG